MKKVVVNHKETLEFEDVYDILDEKQLFKGSKNIPRANAEFQYTPHMIAELKKCKEDIVYFAESYFWIVNLNKGRETIKLYPKQKEALLALQNQRRVSILSARQAGKSTLLTIYVLWTACFNADQRAIIVANKERTAIGIFKRVKMAYEELPNFLKPGIKDYYGKTEMALANGSSIGVSATSPTAIRGESVSVLCIDEAAHINCVTGETQIQVQGADINTIGELYNSGGASKNFRRNTKQLKIQTPEGWKSFLGVKRSGPVPIFNIVLESGKSIKCTKGHILFLSDDVTIPAHEAVGKKIITRDGLELVTQISKMGADYVYDVVGVEGTKSYYTNGVLSHNCNVMDEFWSAVIPAISSSSKSKIFMVSTPAGTENKFYEIHSKAELNPEESGWTPININWFDVPGRDEAWRRDALASLGGDERLFSQEFAISFLDKNESAVGLDIIREFKALNRQPVWSSADAEYLIYEEPDPNKLYVAGVDVGEGIGSAATVTQILDITDLTEIKQAAVFASAVTEPHHYGQKLNVLLNSWGRPPALIERNNCGGQLIDSLFYNHEYDKIIAYSRSKDGGPGTTSSLGVLSTANMRFHAVQNMRYYINTLRAVKVFDKHTIAELETFVRHPNNVYRKQNGDGIRDDRVLSLIWALFVLESDICSLYFAIEEHDKNLKPLKITALEGMKETNPEFYRIRDLTSGLSVDLVPAWVKEAEKDLMPKTEIASWIENYEQRLESMMETEEDYLEAGWQPLA
jgi:hypothetical protein